MQHAHKIKPSMEHYSCMVDALGRAGRLDEAENLIAQLQDPPVVLYKALLGACRVKNDLERAERIGQ